MILGESAGTAAALVCHSSEQVENQVTAQELDYFTLKDKLEENGQLLGEVVIPDKEGTYLCDTYDARFQAVGTLLHLQL